MGKIKKSKEKHQEPAAVAISKPSKQKVQFKSKKNTNSTKNNNSPLISKSTIRLVSTSDDLLSEQTKPATNLKNQNTNANNKKELSKTLTASRITKKDKLKLKHKVLLQKIDTIKQLKKKHKERIKRKNISIIGDTNPLHDALPSLDSLLKNRRDIKIKVASAPNKKKGIPKTKKRQKNVIQGVDMFKKLLSNEKYQKDPLSVISEHVKRRINAGEL